MDLPAAAEPAVAVGVVSLLSVASIRLYASRTAKEPPKTAMRRIRLAIGVGTVLTGVVALLAAVAAGALDLTESALRDLSPALADSPVGAVLTWVPTILGVTVAVVTGYLGAFPYVREIRDLDVSAAEASWSVAKVVAVFFALMIAVVGAMNLFPEGALASALPVLAFLVVVAVVLVALQPRIIALLNDAREPTADERERVARLCETAGVSPHVIRILDLDANRAATAILAGFPGRRHLLVTDDLLADFGDDEAAAVLASKTGRARVHYREAKFAVVLAVVAPLLGLTTGELPGSTGLDPGVLALGVVALAIVLLWFGRRLVFAADDYAVERVGAETYVETLQAIADDHQLSYESGLLRSLLLMRPSLGRRLDRFWGRLGEESGRPDEWSSDDSVE